jgi:hypothetical protein
MDVTWFWSFPGAERDARILKRIACITLISYCQIEQRKEPLCLDLMLSDEWEEIIRAIDDSGEYLERMTQSVP